VPVESVVKIYLFLIDREQFFFYSDESEATQEAQDGSETGGEAHAGLAGWLHSRLDRFKNRWHEAESGLTHWLRRCWDWLHSWSHPDEWMLSQLRSAKMIELHHPASRGDDEVLAIWQDYVARQRNRHLVWLTINGVVAPVTVLFAILPGPNIIGYWFLYRAVHHLLVVWGTVRVRRGRVPTELHPRDALDMPVECDGAGKTRHGALVGGGERLGEHVARSRAPRGSQGRR
jgi:Mitochondrial K+-H+ exchange-related